MKAKNYILVILLSPRKQNNTDRYNLVCTPDDVTYLEDTRESFDFVEKCTQERAQKIEGNSRM